ncbi:hypothetical protein HYU21_01965 [Candidatus Woesearchaeota archaeon]|nr:hypothetical protein [Candidatus Woesearchaeota archaeon]
MNDQAELKKEYESKRKEVQHLRQQLNSIHQEKENYYHQLRTSRDKLRSKLQRIELLKKERNELTTVVKQLKGERNKFNEEAKERRKILQSVDKKKDVLTEEMEVQESPGRLKSQIAKLEEKIETEVIPFEKEKALRKQIKELKAEFKKIEGLDLAWKEHNTAAANFSEKRRVAQEFHQQVQVKADVSQSKHEEISKLYDEIKAIRSEQKPAFEKYKEFKKKYEETKKALEETLPRLTELSKSFQENEERSYQSILREKTAEVQEKIKKRQKLSTRDILAFQATKE